MNSNKNSMYNVSDKREDLTDNEIIITTPAVDKVFYDTIYATPNTNAYKLGMLKFKKISLAAERFLNTLTGKRLVELAGGLGEKSIMPSGLKLKAKIIICMLIDQQLNDDLIINEQRVQREYSGGGVSYSESVNPLNSPYDTMFEAIRSEYRASGIEEYLILLERRIKEAGLLLNRDSYLKIEDYSKADKYGTLKQWDDSTVASVALSENWTEDTSTPDNSTARSFNWIYRQIEKITNGSTEDGIFSTQVNLLNPNDELIRPANEANGEIDNQQLHNKQVISEFDNYTTTTDLEFNYVKKSALQSGYYNKNEIDENIYEKSEVYNKTESDILYGGWGASDANLQSQIDLKVDQSDFDQEIERLDLKDADLVLKDTQQDNRLLIVESELTKVGMDFLIGQESNIVANTTTTTVVPTITRDFQTLATYNNGTITPITDGTINIVYNFNASENTGSVMNLIVELYDITNDVVMDSNSSIIDFTGQTNFNSGNLTLIGNISNGNEYSIRAYTDNGGVLDINDYKVVINVDGYVGGNVLYYDYDINSTNSIGGSNVMESFDLVKNSLDTINSNLTSHLQLINDRPTTSNVNNSLASKADITYVDNQDQALENNKADITYVDEQLNLKANLTYVDTSLATKTNQTDFIEYKNEVDSNYAKKGESGTNGRYTHLSSEEGDWTIQLYDSNNQPSGYLVGQVDNGMFELRGNNYGVYTPNSYNSLMPKYSIEHLKKVYRNNTEIQVGGVWTIETNINYETSLSSQNFMFYVNGSYPVRPLSGSLSTGININNLGDFNITFFFDNETKILEIENVGDTSIPSAQLLVSIEPVDLDINAGTITGGAR